MDPGQELITETIHEWYDAKHRNISEEEIRFINSIQVDKCPACGNTRVIKSGFYDGIQRYKCKTCGIRFSALTNTIFEGKKIPISEWVEYLLHLFEFHSIISSARDNRNAETTGKYWLIKVFEVLKGIQLRFGDIIQTVCPVIPVGKRGQNPDRHQDRLGHGQENMHENLEIRTAVQAGAFFHFLGDGQKE